MAGSGPSSVGSVSISSYSTSSTAGLYFTGSVPSTIQVYYSGTGKTYTATLQGIVAAVSGVASWTSGDASFSINAVIVPTFESGAGSSTVTMIANYAFGADQLVYQTLVGGVSNQPVSWPGLYVAPPSLPSPPPPAAPSNLTVSDNTSSAELDWSAVSRPSGTTLTYEVERGSTSLATGLTSPTYTDASPGASRPLTYGVRARLDGDGSTYSGTTYSSWSTVTTNLAPYKPTLTSPADDSTLDLTGENWFRWAFSSPTSGDAQSAFDIEFSSDAGATWSEDSGGSSASYLAAANSLVAGAGQWRARVYGKTGLVSAWSDPGHFTAATPATDLVITSPSNNGYVNQTSTIEWSISDQVSYQIRRVADNDGAADTGDVYYDSTEVSSSGARSVVLTFDVNNRPEHVQLRVKNSSGLWSAWVDVLVRVAWTPPPAATFSVTALVTKTAALLRYTITTPAASGDVPAATLVDIEARPVGALFAEWSRSLLPVNTTVDFRTPASGVQYETRVTTHADNGTSTSTDWMR